MHIKSVFIQIKLPDGPLLTHLLQFATQIDFRHPGTGLEKHATRNKQQRRDKYRKCPP